MRRIAAVLMAAALMAAMPLSPSALAREKETWSVYVICKPESCVYIRERSSRKAGVLGYAECGDAILTDGVKVGRYLHCIGLTMEDTEGWIHAGYVVDDPPEEVNRYYRNCANGRVAIRRNVNGSRRRWARVGAVLKVLVYSDAWCLTSRGFVRTEYLEMVEEEPDERQGESGPG